ncbi:MAG: hypothetical protein R2850_09625 [Bacteroidia bacterium]
MSNINALYESHHLQVYKDMLDVTFALFVLNPDAMKDDEPVEDILPEWINRYILKDNNYQHLQLVYNALSFEYYHNRIFSKRI